MVSGFGLIRQVRIVIPIIGSHLAGMIDESQSRNSLSPGRGSGGGYRKRRIGVSVLILEGAKLIWPYEVRTFRIILDLVYFDWVYPAHHLHTGCAKKKPGTGCSGLFFSPPSSYRLC